MASPGDVVRGPLDADGLPLWELRCGDWRDVLADVRPAHVITDPPYSARTHGGQTYRRWDSMRYRKALLTPGWLACFTSHDLCSAYSDAAEARGRYAFAPLACVVRGMNVRLAGDGPSNWTTWLCVSRPKSLRHWGTLPGAYVGNPEAERSLVLGSKPLWLMRALVRDYSRPGELVCDPFAGSGTTLLAAAIEGRRAVGAEADPEHFALAVARLRRGFTPSLLAAHDGAAPTQESMHFEGD